MAEREPKDYIGFDPIKWVERLRYVNETSSFTKEQIQCIARHLNALESELAELSD